jgi:uncharacterized protein YbjT (DUF2867 family)
LHIAVTGANSGVGHILLRHLAARGDIQAVAGVRSTRAASGLPASPRISVRAIDYDAGDDLAAAIAGTNCLVHLAGILFEGPTSTYETANVKATQAVVDACRKARVPRIVLVSVLGADAASSNRYLRSKGQAEHVVSGSGLSGTILRTPILLGPGMAGARALVDQASRRSLTLLGGGRHVIRPLDVDDLSQAILRCCEASGTGMSTYELAGPEPLPYRDLVTRTAAKLGHRTTIRSTPIWLARLGATIASWTRRGGMTPTVIDVIT